MTSIEVTSQPNAPTKPEKGRLTFVGEDWLNYGLLLLVGGWLLVFVVLPLYEIISRSLQDKEGNFVGISNYQEYFSSGRLFQSFENSMYISLRSTALTVVLAFIFAYALTRTRMPFKGVLRVLAMLPLFAPSLLHGIAFYYLFGNQGIVTRGYFGYFEEHWGIDLSYNILLYKKPTGIILAEVFYLFPHALLILSVALSLADARLYEAATALGASKIRTFFTVTLPGVKYGLISATFVCFALVFTDFGIPKVIGGTGSNVLAIDVYQKVVGQQNFVMGSTVSVLLLTPTVIGFIIDRLAQRRQMTLLSMRAVPYQPKRNWWLDGLLFVYCLVIVLLILGVIGTAVFASLVERWPYKRDFVLDHYDFSNVAGGGLAPYWNSVRMATWTAIVGTLVVFISAYMIEKGKGLAKARAGLYFLSTLPVALPGLVLGLSYIFFFNNPNNPLNMIYGTMAILVLSTVVHFYTVSFFTATAALKQMDREFEAVSSSLSVPFYRTFFRVTVPIALPAILEIAVYYFVNAMTTVSAVIFLYAADLKLAAIAVVNMDDAGDIQPAAAMSIVIFLTGLSVRIAYEIIAIGLRRYTQAWRQK